MKKIPLTELNISFDRSSGPGGQNVNKVNTKATLRWDFRQSTSIPQDVKDRFEQRFNTRINTDGSVVLQSDKYRSQNRNREACIARLNEWVASVWFPPKKRKKTKPKKSAVEKRLQQKKKHSDTKKNRKKVDYT
ncbi:MAG: alternative ribosome rescue aminoacyl-tRNA hydrolase ArfB [Bdellovibrionales bacterium]